MKKKYKEAVAAYNSTGEDTDVLGSYTGIYRTDSGEVMYGMYPGIYPDIPAAQKKCETPVQDADDL